MFEQVPQPILMCFYYVSLFIGMALLGKFFKKLGKWVHIVFVVLLITLTTSLQYIDIKNLLFVIVLGAYLWGMEYEKKVFSKMIFALPIVLAIIEILLYKFVYTPLINLISHSLGIQPSASYEWLLTGLSLIGVTIGYYLINRLLGARKWIFDLDLAILLLLYWSKILSLFYSLFQA